MHWLLVALLVIGILFGPQLWVKQVMRRHSGPRDDFPGTGGELAQHLVNRFQLDSVTVEPTEKGDHYDPRDRCVRLGENNFHGRSLTAVVIAAHEVGHALQHATGYRPLAWRHRLVGFANAAQLLGNGLIMAMPIVTLLTRVPSTALFMIAGGLLSIGSAALVHLITLPVEWDASFRRALPILEAGEYLRSEDMPAARNILRAAAFTYVAGALASLLNLMRWLQLARR